MTPHTMSLREIIDDIHAMTEDCEIYERKYGVLSETFYESYMNGEEPISSVNCSFTVIR